MDITNRPKIVQSGQGPITNAHKCMVWRTAHQCRTARQHLWGCRTKATVHSLPLFHPFVPEELFAKPLLSKIMQAIVVLPVTWYAGLCLFIYCTWCGSTLDPYPAETGQIRGPYWLILTVGQSGPITDRPSSVSGLSNGFVVTTLSFDSWWAVVPDRATFCCCLYRHPHTLLPL